MSLAQGVRDGLSAHADAEKARGMQAYMKSAMPYHGVNLRQALRQYAWTDPKEVAWYVAEHESQLSGLSRREALKNI